MSLGITARINQIFFAVLKTLFNIVEAWLMSVLYNDVQMDQ